MIATVPFPLAAITRLWITSSLLLTLAYRGEAAARERFDWRQISGPRATLTTLAESQEAPLRPLPPRRQ